MVNVSYDVRSPVLALERDTVRFAYVGRAADTVTQVVALRNIGVGTFAALGPLRLDVRYEGRKRPS